MLAALLLRTGLPGWALKVLEVLIVVGLVVGSYYYAYHHGRSVQLIADQKVMTKYSNDVNTANALQASKVAELQATHLAMVQHIQDRLVYVQDQKDKVVVIKKKEIHNVITPAVDKRSVDANVFTAGWVFNYNRPLASELPSVSVSQPANVDAPTGLNASTVGLVAANNNAECTVRGEVVKAWQTWYGASKAEYEKFVKNAPAQPPIPKLN
jgi:hypothetical protein